MKEIPSAAEIALIVEQSASYQAIADPIIFASLVAKEFAKLHVQAALQMASEKAETIIHKEFLEEFKIANQSITSNNLIYKNSILNAYPLELIK